MSAGKKRRRASPETSAEPPQKRADCGEPSEPPSASLFSDLPLLPQLHAAVNALGLTRPTPVQQRAIPALLAGKDVLASAKTGSGKTLAFLLPALDRLLREQARPERGAALIVIAPTRELAFQTFNVLQSLSPHLSSSLLIGGRSRSRQVKELRDGALAVVATPGRLLDHLEHTEDFQVRALKVLVIDEADRVLSLGFEEQMRRILKRLPERRQSALFSATLTEGAQRLASSALRSANCVRIAVDSAAPQFLTQFVVEVSPNQRFDVLFNFVERLRRKQRKVMVFMASCLSVRFYAKLFDFVECPVMAIHGKMDQSQRSATFFRFCRDESGVLLCTDVAARGLDIPDVHWIVQFDAPADPKDYVHRVGRTARAGASGQALLFLRPHERGFLAVLRDAGLSTQPFQVRWEKVQSVQAALEAVVEEEAELRKLSTAAFKSYVRSYAAHQLRDCFNVEKLDLQAAARMFGLRQVPAGDFLVQSSKKNRKRKERRRKLEKKAQ